MRRARALTLAMLVGAAQAAQAQPACTRADFEAVVDDAAAALRQLNALNKPLFQEKLRQLKEKRGWTHDQFMVEAAPFVQDEQIQAFDQRSAEYLERINSLGAEGASAKTPDCSILAIVRENMAALVSEQKAKWTYMFEKIGRVLGP
jgi:phosphoglycerate-specific signal transduction histidine kinase